MNYLTQLQKMHLPDKVQNMLNKMHNHFSDHQMDHLNAYIDDIIESLMNDGELNASEIDNIDVALKDVMRLLEMDISRERNLSLKRIQWLMEREIAEHKIQDFNEFLNNKEVNGDILIEQIEELMQLAEEPHLTDEARKRVRLAVISGVSKIQEAADESLMPPKLIRALLELYASEDSVSDMLLGYSRAGLKISNNKPSIADNYETLFRIKEEIFIFDPHAQSLVDNAVKELSNLMLEEQSKDFSFKEKHTIDRANSNAEYWLSEYASHYNDLYDNISNYVDDNMDSFSVIEHAIKYLDTYKQKLTELKKSKHTHIDKYDMRILSELYDTLNREFQESFLSDNLSYVLDDAADYIMELDTINPEYLTRLAKIAEIPECQAEERMSAIKLYSEGVHGFATIYQTPDVINQFYNIDKFIHILIQNKQLLDSSDIQNIQESLINNVVDIIDSHPDLDDYKFESLREFVATLSHYINYAESAGLSTQAEKLREFLQEQMPEIVEQTQLMTNTISFYIRENQTIDDYIDDFKQCMEYINTVYQACDDPALRESLESTSTQIINQARSDLYFLATKRGLFGTFNGTEKLQRQYAKMSEAVRPEQQHLLGERSLARQIITNYNESNNDSEVTLNNFEGIIHLFDETFDDYTAQALAIETLVQEFMSTMNDKTPRPNEAEIDHMVKRIHQLVDGTVSDLTVNQIKAMNVNSPTSENVASKIRSKQEEIKDTEVQVQDTHKSQRFSSK